MASTKKVKRLLRQIIAAPFVPVAIVLGWLSERATDVVEALTKEEADGNAH